MMQRLPIRPLADAVGGQENLASFLGVTKRTVERRVARGHGFDYYEADAAAIACGFMPGEVWRDWSELTSLVHSA